MAEHIWSVPCKNILQDTHTNLVSLFEVLEKITIEKGQEQLSISHREGKRGFIFPLSMQLVSLWTRSDWSKPETGMGGVALINPSGETMIEQRFDIKLQEGDTSRRHLVIYDRFPLSAFGLHWFVVSQWRPSKSGKTGKWYREARAPIEVVAG